MFGGKSRRIMCHDKLIDRLRKSFYYGANTLVDEMQISRPLAEYASELFSTPHKGHSLDRLNPTNAGKLAAATPCSLIMAFIYLDRLNAKNPIYVRRITPQELFIVSVMISTKFYSGHDEEIYLSDWAEDGNMTEDRLKQLEMEFLYAIDWNIYISNEEFFQKLASIEKTLAKREGLRRGWLTYTELVQMLPSFAATKFLLNMLVNNIAVMLVSYAAGVMTIAGAFFLASQIPGHALHRKTASTTSISDPSTSSSLSPPTTSSTVLDSVRTDHVSRPCYARRKNVMAESDANTDNNSETETIDGYNATCIALNIEGELSKLNRQYREEALLEDIRNRNNERTTPIFWMALGDVMKETQLQQSSHEKKLEKNWLTFKNEYSDELLINQKPLIAVNDNNNNNNNNNIETRMKPAKNLSGVDDPVDLSAFSKCLNNFSNCTTSIFWEVLTEATDKSLFVGTPTIQWFKFM